MALQFAMCTIALKMRNNLDSSRLYDQTTPHADSRRCRLLSYDGIYRHSKQIVGLESESFDFRGRSSLMKS